MPTNPLPFITILSFFTPEFFPAPMTKLSYQFPSFLPTTLAEILVALYSSCTKFSVFFNSSSDSVLSSLAFKAIIFFLSFSFSSSNFFTFLELSLKFATSLKPFLIKENPSFIPLPTLVIASEATPKFTGLPLENLPIDIPTIPIKVIATTPVAITLTLILFFSFLFLSNLKAITNF